jgi:hypothetical protein
MTPLRRLAPPERDATAEDQWTALGRRRAMTTATCVDIVPFCIQPSVRGSLAGGHAIGRLIVSSSARRTACPSPRFGLRRPTGDGVKARRSEERMHARPLDVAGLVLIDVVVQMDERGRLSGSSASTTSDRMAYRPASSQFAQRSEV